MGAISGAHHHRHRHRDLNGLDIAVQTGGEEPATGGACGSVGINNGQHLRSGALDGQSVGIHGEEICIVGNHILAVYSRNRDPLLNDIQANIAP